LPLFWDHNSNRVGHAQPDHELSDSHGDSAQREREGERRERERERRERKKREGEGERRERKKREREGERKGFYICGCIL